MPKWPFVSPCALACSEIQKLSYLADLILILQPSSPAPHGAPQFQMPQVSTCARISSAAACLCTFIYFFVLVESLPYST